MSKPNDTPMMLQFNEIKKQYPDCILFFRMGDFYEMFDEDANIASKILNIALTSRNKNVDFPVPMCGIPYHSYRQYLIKLINAGLKVAICEQLEDPAKSKGLVKRGVIRVVSSGTMIEEEELPSEESSFLLSIYKDDKKLYHIACADVSTGEFYVTTNPDYLLEQKIDTFSPREIILDDNIVLSFIPKVPIHKEKIKSIQNAKKNIIEKFNISDASHLGIPEGCIVAAYMIVNYVNEAMIEVVFSKPTYITPDGTLLLDSATISALDIESKDNIKEHGLFGVLNKTSTPMGARQLKWWIKNPIRDIYTIKVRLQSVDFFTKNWAMLLELENLLRTVGDIERIAGRVSGKRVTPKELIRLKTSLDVLPYIKDLLESTGNRDINKLGELLSSCGEISDIVANSIDPNPSPNIKEGGIIKRGFNETVDKLRDIKNNGRQALVNLESKLKRDTGINQLKISYNKVFGYYIEVSKASAIKVPSIFERKQTLVNAERYVTPELKELELLLLNAEDKLGIVEYELFCNIRDKIIQHFENLKMISHNIATLDCYISLARVAVSNGYCMPKIAQNDTLSIQGGRHPVVELNSNDVFIPNNTFIDNNDNRLIILTGPNMSGKSTYIRSVALIVIMGHIGSFVPADKAVIPLCDRIFTRIGANDNISKGESTFMTEMIETSNILKHATNKSLIILDEIGRGTATYDGLSIAWAVSEYILNNIKAKTLFATHYHELTEMDKYDGVKNYTVQVKEEAQEVIFLRKICPGSAYKSYGIYVAKLAGLPNSVIQKATEILYNLESSNINKHESQIDILNKKNHYIEVIIDPIREFITNIDPNLLTPLQALNKIYELKEMVANKSNTI